jgi:sugar O-acyltransferase (sialic acid O-acetyltransferase NeuD family)
MKAQKVIILGAFHETIELCELCGMDVVGLVDNNMKGLYCGYPIIGTDNDVTLLAEKYKEEVLLVNGPDSSKVKRILAKKYGEAGFSFATVVSPKANVSKSAKIGEGSIVQSGVNISSNSQIGKFCKFNFNSNVMHDVKMGDYVVIAPNSVILGRAEIGDDVYIGANSTIEHDTIVKNETKIPTATYFNNE